MSYKAMLWEIVFLVLLLEDAVTILLPCTENADAGVVNVARNIILQAVPPGYTLDNVEPLVTLGRNPHRWVARFRRNDNNYGQGCAFLTAAKNDFKRYCPQGSEIRTVALVNIPNGQCISVEILVNCYCRNRRRRRRSFSRYFSNECRIQGYTREPPICEN